MIYQIEGFQNKFLLIIFKIYFLYNNIKYLSIFSYLMEKFFI